jgi:branched-chain amino acid transport system permease protein
MLDPYIQRTLVQTSLIVIMSIGFTWTYMVEKFPNFAQTAFATLGTLLTYHLAVFYGLTPYQSLPVSMISCGLLGALIYLLVVRPIKRYGSREITLTFAFFSFALMIGSITNIYSYWLMFTGGSGNGFMLGWMDFEVGGIPGVVYAAPTVAFTLILLLFLFLRYVKLGIAIRAVAEDEELSGTFGVDTLRVHLASWFMTGALAGLAGGILPLFRSTGLGGNDDFLITVMAGSIMGGLNSISGAMLGGAIVSISKDLVNSLLIAVWGIRMEGFVTLIPIVFIFVILMLQPNGIVAWATGPHNPRETLHNTLIRAQTTITDIQESLKSLRRTV